MILSRLGSVINYLRLRTLGVTCFISGGSSTPRGYLPVRVAPFSCAQRNTKQPRTKNLPFRGSQLRRRTALAACLPCWRSEPQPRCHQRREPEPSTLTLKGGCSAAGCSSCSNHRTSTLYVYACLYKAYRTFVRQYVRCTYNRTFVHFTP